MLLVLLVAAGVGIGVLLYQGYFGNENPGGQRPLSFGGTSVSGSGPWSLLISGTNVGGSTQTVTDVRIGGVDFAAQVAPPGLPMPLQPGSGFAMTVALANGGALTFVPGESLTIEVMTGDGMVYQVMASLPSSTTTGGGGGGGSGGNEKVILSGSVIGGTLNVTALNQSPGAVTFLHVYFNGVPASVTYGQGFSTQGLLPSGATGTFVVATSGTVSGALYNLEVITASGNSFQTVVSWP